MGATAWSYLTGYDDPRLDKYYKKGVYEGKEDYYCIASCNTMLRRLEKTLQSMLLVLILLIMILCIGSVLLKLSF